MGLAQEPILAALRRIEERLADLAALTPALSHLEEHLINDREVLPAASHPPASPSYAQPMPTGGNEEESWLELSEAQVAALLAPFANEGRIKLLKALYLGIAETNRLRQFTGLSGGQLYHHLKELALAKFLARQVRGEYRLSSYGYYAFAALMIMTADLLAEEIEDEVVTPEEIDLE